jgi:hypothetical protein
MKKCREKVDGGSWKFYVKVRPGNPEGNQENFGPDSWHYWQIFQYVIFRVQLKTSEQKGNNLNMAKIMSTLLK